MAPTTCSRRVGSQVNTSKMDDFILDLLYFPSEKAPETGVPKEPLKETVYAEDLEDTAGDYLFLTYCFFIIVVGISGFMLKCIVNKLNRKLGDASPQTSHMTQTLISKDDSQDMTMYYPNGVPFSYGHTNGGTDGRTFRDSSDAHGLNFKRSHHYVGQTYHPLESETLKNSTGPLNDSTVASTTENVFNRHPTLDSRETSPPRIKRFKKRTQSDSCSDSDRDKTHQYMKINENTKWPSKSKVQPSSNRDPKPSVRIDEFGDVMCLQAKGCNSTVSSITKTSMKRSHTTKSLLHSPNPYTDKDIGDNTKSMSSLNPASSHIYISAGQVTVEVTKSSRDGAESPLKMKVEKTQVEGNGLSSSSLSPMSKRSDSASRTNKKRPIFPQRLDWKKSSQFKRGNKRVARFDQWDRPVGMSKREKYKNKHNVPATKTRMRQNNLETLSKASVTMPKSQQFDQTTTASKLSPNSRMNKQYIIGSRPTVGFASQQSPRKKGNKTVIPKSMDIRDPKYFSVETRNGQSMKNENEISTCKKKSVDRYSAKERQTSPMDNYSPIITTLRENLKSTRPNPKKEKTAIERHHGKLQNLLAGTQENNDAHRKRNNAKTSQPKLHFKNCSKYSTIGNALNSVNLGSPKMGCKISKEASPEKLGAVENREKILCAISFSNPKKSGTTFNKSKCIGSSNPNTKNRNRKDEVHVGASVKTGEQQNNITTSLARDGIKQYYKETNEISQQPVNIYGSKKTNKIYPCATNLLLSENKNVASIPKHIEYTSAAVGDLSNAKMPIQTDAKANTQKSDASKGLSFALYENDLFTKHYLQKNRKHSKSESESSSSENNSLRLQAFKSNNECLLYLDSPYECNAQRQASHKLYNQSMQPRLFQDVKTLGRRRSVSQISAFSTDGKQSNAQKMNDDIVKERIEKLTELTAQYKHKNRKHYHQRHNLNSFGTSRTENLRHRETKKDKEYFASGEMMEELRRNGCLKSIQMLEGCGAKPYFGYEEFQEDIRGNYGVDRKYEQEKDHTNKDQEGYSLSKGLKRNSYFERYFRSHENEDRVTKTEVPLISSDESENERVNLESNKKQWVSPYCNNVLQFDLPDGNDTELYSQYSRALPSGENQDKKTGPNLKYPVLTLSTNLPGSPRLYEDIVENSVRKMSLDISKRILKNSLKHKQLYLGVPAGGSNLPKFDSEPWEQIESPKVQTSRSINNIKFGHGETRCGDKNDEKTMIVRRRTGKTNSKNMKSDLIFSEQEKNVSDSSTMPGGKCQQKRTRLIGNAQIQSSVSMLNLSNDMSNEVDHIMTKPSLNRENAQDAESYSICSGQLRRPNEGKESSGDDRNAFLAERGNGATGSRKREEEVKATTNGRLDKCPRKEIGNLMTKSDKPQITGRHAEDKQKTALTTFEDKPKPHNRLSKTKRLRYIFHKAPVKPKIKKDEINPASASEQNSQLDQDTLLSSSKKDTRPINSSSYQVLQKDNKAKPKIGTGRISPQNPNLTTKCPIYKCHKPAGSTPRTVQETNIPLTENKKEISGKKEGKEMKDTTRVGESFTSTYKTLHKKRNQAIPIPPVTTDKQARRTSLLSSKQQQQYNVINKRSSLDASKQNSLLEEDKSGGLEGNMATKGVKEGYCFRSTHASAFNTKLQAQKSKTPGHVIPNEMSSTKNGEMETKCTASGENGKKQPRNALPRPRLNNGRANTTDTVVTAALTKKASKNPKGQSYLQVYRDSVKVWSPSLPVLTQSIEKLSDSNLSKDQVEGSEVVDAYSNADVPSEDEFRDPCTELDIIDITNTKTGQNETLNFSTTQYNDDFDSIDLIDTDGKPLSTLNAYESHKSGLNSMLSNLACIEHLDPDEEEKLLLPQHLPDLITTSSGDLSGVTNNVSGYSHSGYVLENHIYGSNETCNHARNNQNEDSKQSIKLSLSPTCLFDGIIEKRDNKILLSTAAFDEKIPSPGEKVEKINTVANVTETLEECGRIDQPNTNSCLMKNNESASNRETKGSIDEIKMLNSIQITKKTSCSITERSSPERKMSFEFKTTKNVDLKSSLTKFTTPNFHDIFKDTETLQKWTKANIPPKEPLLSPTMKPVGVARKSESAKCLKQKVRETFCSKQSTHEIIKTKSLDKSVRKDTNAHRKENTTPRDILKAINLSDNTKERHLTSPKDKGSGIALQMKNFVKPSQREQLKTPPRLKNDVLDFDGVQGQNIADGESESEKSNHQSCSDIVISWLDDEGKCANSKRKHKCTSGLNSQHNRDEESPKRATPSGDTTVGVGKAESLAEKTQSNVPEQEKDSGSYSRCAHSSKTGEENVFLKMARIKRSNNTERTMNNKGSCVMNVKREQFGLMVSPPKGTGYYVTSAMSYTKKKCLCSTNNSICTHDTFSVGNSGDETLIQDHLTGLESISNMRECSSLTPNTARDSAQTPKRMTKNNNKTRITLTSMYTTLIDAVELDVTGSSSCNARSFDNDDLLPHVFDEENWDDTSNDVLTDELCSDCSSSWSDYASSEQNVMLASTFPDNQADATDCTSHSQHSSNGQPYHESKLLDWYRPSLQAKTVFGSTAHSAAEEYDDDNDDDDDDDDDDGDDEDEDDDNDDAAADDNQTDDAEGDRLNDGSINDGNSDDDSDDDNSDYDDSHSDGDAGEDGNDNDGTDGDGADYCGGYNIENDSDYINDNDDGNFDFQDDGDADAADDVDCKDSQEAVADEYADRASLKTTSIGQEDNNACTSSGPSCHTGYFTSHSSTDGSSTSLSNRRSLGNTNSAHTDQSFRSAFTWCNRHKNLNHTLSNNNKFVVSMQVESNSNSNISNSPPSRSTHFDYGDNCLRHQWGFVKSSSHNTKMSGGRHGTDVKESQCDDHLALDKANTNSMIVDGSVSSVEGFSTLCHASNSDKEVECRGAGPGLNTMSLFKDSPSNIKRFNCCRRQLGGVYHPRTNITCRKSRESTRVAGPQVKCEGIRCDEGLLLWQKKKKWSNCNLVGENKFCTCPSSNVVHNDWSDRNEPSSENLTTTKSGRCTGLAIGDSLLDGAIAAG